MYIKIEGTKQELKTMEISQDKLEQLLLEYLDKMEHKEMKIFHQVELGVYSEIKNK